MCLRPFVSTFHTPNCFIWAKSDEKWLQKGLTHLFSTFQNLRLGSIKCWYKKNEPTSRPVSVAIRCICSDAAMLRCSDAVMFLQTWSLVAFLTDTYRLNMLFFRQTHPVSEIPESRFIVYALKRRFLPVWASYNRGFRGLIVYAFKRRFLSVWASYNRGFRGLLSPLGRNEYEKRR